MIVLPTPRCMIGTSCSYLLVLQVFLVNISSKLANIFVFTCLLNGALHIFACGLSAKTILFYYCHGCQNMFTDSTSLMLSRDTARRLNPQKPVIT